MDVKKIQQALEAAEKYVRTAAYDELQEGRSHGPANEDLQKVHGAQAALTRALQSN